MVIKSEHERRRDPRYLISTEEGPQMSTRERSVADWARASGMTVEHLR